MRRVAKKDAKLREREDAVARRKAEQEDAPPDAEKTDALREAWCAAPATGYYVMKRRSLSSFVLFDVTYVDGSRSSNRKVLSSVLESFEGEAAAAAVIEAQDREIAAASGRSRSDIKSIRRVRT
jgi:hypothetical protein